MDWLRIHSDGHQAAFTAGKRNFEVWVMENFLPASPRAGLGRYGAPGSR